MGIACEAPTHAAGTIRERVINHWPAAVVGLASVAAIGFQLQGLTRSLWLDEAWVANAVLESNIARMLVYRSWVPAPEPGFLLSSRLVATALGPSNLTFRAVPLAFSLIGLLAMFLLLRRLFAPAWAAVGFAMFAFSPPATEYAHTFKQYSTELSMVPLFLLAAVRWNEEPTRFNFIVLLLTVVLTTVFAYPIVFIVPAILIIFLSRPRRDRELRHLIQAISAALVGFVTFATLYFVVIRRNMTSSLHLYFANRDNVVGFVPNVKRDLTGILNPFKGLLPIPWRYIQPAMISLAVLCALGLAAAAVLLYRIRRGYRPGLVLAVSFPFFAVFCLDLLNLYPGTQRTTLFLLPCRVILVVALLELIVSTIRGLDFYWRRPIAAWAAPVLAVLIVGIGCARQQQYKPVVPMEDPQDAIAWLKTQYRQGDALYVHASMEEDFKLYARLLNFRPASVQWGNTGWPCCPRNVEYWKGRGSVRRIDENLTSLYGTALPERLWTLESLRRAQWTYIGLDEAAALQSLLLQRGCTLISQQQWKNVGLNLFLCGSKGQFPNIHNALAPSHSPADDRQQTRPGLMHRSSGGGNRTGTK